jgi:putative membrane protein
VNPIPVLVLAAGVAYVLALGPNPVRPEARARRRLRAMAFFGGLAVVLLALSGPIEAAAVRFQWAHMAQHLLLVIVAAPLFVLAEPWFVPLRMLPRRARGPLARVLFRDSRTALLRAAAAFVCLPAVAWLLFNGVFLAFHVPWLYGMTLRYPLVHDLEHVAFLGLAVLFWVPVIRRAGPQEGPRFAYLVAAGFVGSALGAWLAFASAPLYRGYHGSASLSALADQRIAAGLMGGVGSLVFALAAGLIIYRWLGDQERAVTPRVAGWRSA